MNRIIRLGPADDRIEKALELAYEVFCECEAPLYSAEGAESFTAFLYGDRFKAGLTDGSAVVYICEENGDITGMMAIRDGRHICLAFVKHGQRQKGIGRMLFERIISDHPGRDITVNAAPTGYEFYKHMGFIPADMELMDDGIIYTPMIRVNKL